MITGIPLILALILICQTQIEWDMIRNEKHHTGFVTGEIKAPLHPAWSTYFLSERFGSNFEPVFSEDRVFVNTHNGSVYALDDESGKAIWRFHTDGCFLNSPAVFRNLVISGCTDGYLYALDNKSGEVKWSLYAGQGGFSAAPVISDGKIFIGARNGIFLAVDALSGKIIWKQNTASPIRQTA
ncbi:PQQ-binding-like beta-propeller repeat protein, partial [Candidatus Poribacteria bacterium]|nr:PQQ-binding-like beta-propeller repeat protein [Candidatus Poribacteria bacterium]